MNAMQDLDSPERNLVKEGQVYLKNVKKLYQCILFNDVLVFAHGDSRQSKVELQLDLEAVWFENLEDLDPQTSKGIKEVYKLCLMFMARFFIFIVLCGILASDSPTFS